VRRARLVAVHALSEYDARVLTQTAAGADYFEEVAERTGEPKLAANWVMGAAQAAMNARGQDARTFAVRPTALAELIGLVVDGTISDGAAKAVLDAVADGEGSPRTIVEERGLRQVRDSSALEAWVREVVEAHPDEVARYGGGEKKLLGFLVGQVMKRSGGKADPRRVNELLRAELS
jgi:aspartyl-tRNA(Asn)/glutamyl-tRNA(Gln) amidotransferase subunit B